MRTDRLAPPQFPATRSIAKRLGRKGTNRTEVDHVAGKLGVNRSTDESHDLRMHVAVGHAEFHYSGNFLTEADATRAVDATRHLLHRDERADVLVKDHALAFLETRRATAVADRQVLQLTLATLIADRTVEGMIDQQELHHALLRLDGQFGMREYLHAVGHRRRAGRQGLRRLLDLYQTHAAVGSDRELLVVAEMRDIGANLLGSIHDGTAIRHLRHLAVYFDFHRVGP